MVVVGVVGMGLCSALLSVARQLTVLVWGGLQTKRCGLVLGTWETHRTLAEHEIKTVERGGCVGWREWSKAWVYTKGGKSLLALGPREEADGKQSKEDAWSNCPGRPRPQTCGNRIVSTQRGVPLHWCERTWSQEERV